MRICRFFDRGNSGVDSSESPCLRGEAYLGSERDCRQPGDGMPGTLGNASVWKAELSPMGW